MADIFISYAREDLDRVRPIVRFIEDNGWSVFWDRTTPPGLTWREYIGKALDEAKCVIVVWSRNSVTSEFVQEEADDGRERKILVPIRIDNAKPPLGFRAIQHEDFTNWKGESDNRRVKRLIKAIEGFAGKSKKKAIVPPAKLKPEVQPLQKQEPASKPEEPMQDSPFDTSLRPPSSRIPESSPPKRKTGFFFKLGLMIVSLTVAAVILIVGLNFWLKGKNRPTTSPPAVIKESPAKKKATVSPQIEPMKEIPKADIDLPDSKQSIKDQQRVLDMIAEFADRFCKNVPLQGSGENLELSANAKAELRQLISEIVDLKIEETKKEYQSDAYQGILQKDLASAFKDSTDCRLQIFKDLSEILLGKNK